MLPNLPRVYALAAGVFMALSGGGLLLFRDRWARTVAKVFPSFPARGDAVASGLILVVLGAALVLARS